MADDGCEVGAIVVGSSVGYAEGMDLGIFVGLTVLGKRVDGTSLGWALGNSVGTSVGINVGASVGNSVGTFVGLTDG